MMKMILYPQTSLKKKKILGVVYGIGMNVNNIVGSGIVTTPGTVWGLLKSPRIVMILWAICGFVAMSGSLSYVELGVIHKDNGGELKYLRTAYPYKNMMSYLFSFMCIFAIRPGYLSAILQSAAQYFWYTIKGHRYDKELEYKENTAGWHLLFSPFWSLKILAILILFIITLYHMLSNKWAVYINQTLAVIKLTSYSIIAVAGIYQLISDRPESLNNWQTLLSGDPPNIAAYSTSILMVMFSYDGWNNLNYSLDEFRKPEKKLIYSNSISVIIVTLLYLLINVAFISVVPGDSVVDKVDDETIAASFFRKLFKDSEIAARIFTGLIVLSLMGTAASEIWSGSRIIVAAAESNFFPKYSKGLKSWNDRFNTPINALLAQFIWCSSIIIFVGGSFSISSFKLFSSFSIYSYWIFYFATGIGLLVIRYKKKNNNNYTFKVPLPIAGIFILAGLCILILSFVFDCPVNNKECIIKELSPIFVSYGFLLFALKFWYFLYYRQNSK